MKMRATPSPSVVTSIFAIERRLSQLMNAAEENEPRETNELTPKEAQAVRIFLRMHALRQPEFETKEPQASKILQAVLHRFVIPDEDRDPLDSGERVSLSSL